MEQTNSIKEKILLNSSIQVEGGSHNEPSPDNASKQPDNATNAFIATIFASLGALNFGYTMGFTSPIEVALEEDTTLHLSKGQFAWFASIVAIGAGAGSIISGFTVEKIGRRTTIITTSMLFIPGWFLISFATNIAMLYLGRIFTGIGVGMCSLAVPLYIAEVSSSRMRGALGSMNQLAITLGILLAFFTGAQVSWNHTAMVPLLITMVMATAMYFMPETPRWLLTHQRRHAAIKELHWLRGPTYDVIPELSAAESMTSGDDVVGNDSSLKDFLDVSFTNPLLIGCMLMVFQQCCGINVILFYCASIFKAAGYDNAEQVSLFVAGSQVVATVFSCLIVDKSGRKVLLMVGGLAMATCNLLLGLYFDVSKAASNTEDTTSTLLGNVLPASFSLPPWLAVLASVGFMLSFAFSWGPIPWLMMSEILPSNIVGAASSLVTLVNWTLVFLLTNSFDFMMNIFHEQGIFFLFSLCSFLSFLFTFLYVPETKGKSLQEIEGLFSRKSRLKIV